MNTTLVRTARRSLVVLLATVSAFLTLNLAPAQAVQLYGASGQPGSISPGYVTGTTTNSCYPVGNCLSRQLHVPGPTVGRSPNGNTAQDVRIQFRVYRWNGTAWALHSRVNRAYSMGYHARVRLPDFRLNVGAGHYSVQESLSWHVSSTGMTLGSRGVNFNGNDYACSSQLACSASTGWLRFG